MKDAARSEKINAPWTDEQVNNANDYQCHGNMHPFTCGGDRRDIPHELYADAHGTDYGQLVATNDGWVCPVCDYKQAWAWDFMLNEKWNLPASAVKGEPCQS